MKSHKSFPRRILIIVIGLPLMLFALLWLSGRVRYLLSADFIDYDKYLIFHTINDPDGKLSDDEKKRIIATALLISEFDDTDVASEQNAPVSGNFFWDDVAVSMLKTPEAVMLESLPCYRCGNQTVKLWFSSPPFTWQHLCGSAGNMRVCLQCKTQLFQSSIEN